EPNRPLARAARPAWRVAGREGQFRPQRYLVALLVVEILLRADARHVSRLTIERILQRAVVVDAVDNPAERLGKVYNRQVGQAAEQVRLRDAVCHDDFLQPVTLAQFL